MTTIFVLGVLSAQSFALFLDNQISFRFRPVEGIAYNEFTDSKYFFYAEGNMELAVILLLFAGFLIFFKLIGLIFKAGFFVLSIPFQIVGAVFGVLFLVIFFPVILTAGVLTAVFAPLLVMGPLLPFLLVLLGLYLILKK